jgi:hypothetical protein
MERALRRYLRDRARAAAAARVGERINRAADERNNEAEDALSYQSLAD